MSSYRYVQAPGTWHSGIEDKKVSDQGPTQDATTNPSLILAAANKPQYARLIDAAVEHGKSKGGSVDEQANAAMDRLASFWS
jgi:transaldolase